MNSNDPTHLGRPGHILGDVEMDMENELSDRPGDLVLELSILSMRYTQHGDLKNAAIVGDYAIEQKRKRDEAKSNLHPVMAQALAPFLKVSK